MKIGDKVYVRGDIDNIRENICSVIIQNDSGRFLASFVTNESDVMPTQELHSYLLNKAYDNVLDLITTSRAEHDDKGYLNACDDIAFIISAFLKSDEALEMFENKILKPCPFCGKDARVKKDLRFEQKSYKFQKYYVECKGCYIRTKAGKIQYAIERWNTRKVGDQE